MKRRAYTLVVMIGMVLLGVLYWFDLSYFVDDKTGFVNQFPLWGRYLLVVVLVVLSILGLRGVSPYSVGLMRVKSSLLSVLFGLAGIFGVLYGITSVVFFAKVQPQEMNSLGAAYSQSIDIWYQFLLGISYIWYGIWMLLVSHQMIKQDRPSPTKSAVLGMFAAFPFCLQTVYRAILNPNSIYRLENLVNILSALFTMLWFGMLLRALYIALVHKRVRWMYLFGLITFLFSACFQFTQIMYEISLNGFTLILFFDALNKLMLGIVTGVVSLEIASREELKPKRLIVKLKRFPKDPTSFN